MSQQPPHGANRDEKPHSSHTEFAGTSRQRRLQREREQPQHQADAAVYQETGAQDSAHQDADPQESRSKRRNPVVSFLIEVGVIVLAAVVISFLIKTFLLRSFYIPSESMQPTLEVDDRIIVNVMAPGVMDVHRGDVVVFEDTRSWWGGEQTETNAFQDALVFIGLMPDTTSHFVVKRVVGTGGDTVECCDDQGRIMVNGEPIDEPYLYPGNAPSEIDFEVDVPEDHVWLMGDHRAVSLDSRAHVSEPDAGAVPLEDVIGRNAAVIWPTDHWARGGAEREAFEDVPEPSR